MNEEKNTNILKLIEAQDIIRRVWCNLPEGSQEKHLKEIDREITISINSFGTGINKYIQD